MLGRGCRLAPFLGSRAGVPFGVRQLSSYTSTAQPMDLRFMEYPVMQQERTPDLPPLVVIHGLLGSAMNWKGIASRPEFAGGRRVFGVDLRNHGASPHSEDMSYDALQADIMRFLESQRIDRAVLLGHSLGGKVAMMTALCNPDAIAAVVVADIAPKYYRMNPEGEIPTILGALNDMDLGSVTSRAQADLILKASVPDQRIRGFVLQNLVRRGTFADNPDTATVQKSDGAQPEFVWRVNAPVLQAKLPQISAFEGSDEAIEANGPFYGPSLFVHGGRSAYVQPEVDYMRIKERYFPASEFHCIPDAGHWVHADQPNAFVEVVSKFLKGLP